MDIIYEPKGRAREIAELACNLYRGCRQSCRYCYVPDFMHIKRSIFHSNYGPRSQIITRLAADCKKMSGDPREILLSFTCDVYQDWPERAMDITRLALEVLERYRMKVTVLTKGGLRAVRDFDILKRNAWSFGITLSMTDEILRKQWEPLAASIPQRIRAIQMAHTRGIKTWVSIEPVISIGQALKAIYFVSPWADRFVVGKMNHDKEIEDREDWPLFLEQVEELLRGHSYYIKNDLWAAAGRKPRQEEKSNGH